jgi:hypothetical protein
MSSHPPLRGAAAARRPAGPGPSRQSGRAGRH